MLNIREKEILHKDVFIYSTFFYQFIEDCIKKSTMEKAFRITKRAKVIFPHLNPVQ